MASIGAIDPIYLLCIRWQQSIMCCVSSWGWNDLFWGVYKALRFAAIIFCFSPSVNLKMQLLGFYWSNWPHPNFIYQQTPSNPVWGSSWGWCCSVMVSGLILALLQWIFVVFHQPKWICNESPWTGPNDPIQRFLCINRHHVTIFEGSSWGETSFLACLYLF